MSKFSQITLFWAGFIGLTLLLSAMLPALPAGADAMPTVAVETRAPQTTQPAQIYRIYLSGVNLPPVTLTGSVAIEGGACCVGGTAGTPLNIGVNFFAAEAAQMRVRTAGMCFDANGLNQASWETYVTHKTYVYTPPINWSGFYVSVQYRNTLGHLSPVYCDDISVEGMPPSGTTVATVTYPPPCPLIEGALSPTCTQSPPVSVTPCTPTPTPHAIILGPNGVLTTAPPPTTPAPCGPTQPPTLTPTPTLTGCHPTATPTFWLPPTNTPWAQPLLTATPSWTPAPCPATHTPTPIVTQCPPTATPTPWAPPTNTPVAPFSQPLLTATPPHPCAPTPPPCPTMPTPTPVHGSPTAPPPTSTPLPVYTPTPTPTPHHLGGPVSQPLLTATPTPPDPCGPPPTPWVTITPTPWHGPSATPWMSPTPPHATPTPVLP